MNPSLQAPVLALAGTAGLESASVCNGSLEVKLVSGGQPLPELLSPGLVLIAVQEP